MEEDFSINDFKNVIVLRNQLLTLSSEELKELYQDYKNYLIFLDTVSVLASTDSGFLLLSDDILDKIQDVIQYNRFEGDTDVVDVANEVIEYINLVRYYPPAFKKALQSSYFEYHSEVRKKKIKTGEELAKLLAYDAQFIVGLEENKFNNVEDDYFLSSLNYLLSTSFELFDENNLRLVKSVLKDILARLKFFDFGGRNYCQKTLSNFKHYQ